MLTHGWALRLSGIWAPSETLQECNKTNYQFSAHPSPNTVQQKQAEILGSKKWKSQALPSCSPKGEKNSQANQGLYGSSSDADPLCNPAQFLEVGVAPSCFWRVLPACRAGIAVVPCLMEGWGAKMGSPGGPDLEMHTLG